MTTFRRRWISDPLFDWAKASLPSLSNTEREALEAGDVWWDADLFSGAPDWTKLHAFPQARLSEEEQAFIDGPTAELCAMIDDWDITHERGDLPPDVWEFMKRNKFFGMIIPKSYGGLGFSAFAHSEVVKRISTRSPTAAVTAMVPNSLGPGELLMMFGTDAQKSHYLPRLADGREIPCFGLTSVHAGSDAASMIDHGVVCRGVYNGEKVLGLRINWSKRYITLGPIATLLGVAFKLSDPDHLLGEEDELGITVALVPVDTPGVETGRRHLPGLQAFQNGPIAGSDVFLPLDAIIGGRERAGEGWKMLMSALSAGRGISLPTLSTAATAAAASTTGAYARIRRQFGVPIGKFEGVQEPLGRIAGLSYKLEAARRMTCSALDQGHHPAIVSAIMKLHATEAMRVALNDAMDVHGGKAVCDGPLNYLGNAYRAVPIAITVEGANIMTRNLIVFGQGAIRCHPYLLEEMLILEDSDEAAAREKFDTIIWRHIGHVLQVMARSLATSWTGALIGRAPGGGATARYYRRAGRYAAALALCSELSLITLGGALKRKESISARLGDILSELYFISAVLKRFEDDGRPADDLALVDWVCESGFAKIEAALAGVIRNFPIRPVAWAMRILAQPFGPRRIGPSDRTVHACAQALMAPGAQRDRLTDGVMKGATEDGISRLDDAFALDVETEPLRQKIKEAGHEDDWAAAEKAGIIGRAERERLDRRDQAILGAIVVDDFAPDAMAADQISEKNVA